MAARTSFVVVAAALLFCGTQGLAVAQSTRLEYRVVFASARELPRRIDEAGQQGFACAIVARPEPNVALPGVVVVLSRPVERASTPATHRIIRGGGRGTDLPPLLDRAGAEGLQLCGIALDEEAPNPTIVAVMRPAPDPGPWRHGAEVLSDYRGAIGRLNTAGKDGFAPVAVAPVDNNRVPWMRSWVVVTERPASGRPQIEVAVRSASGAETFQGNLGEQTKQGYRISLAWKEGNDFVAMMTRPAGSTAAAPAYAIDGSAALGLRGLPGLYVADFPYLSDRRLVISEQSGSATNEVVEDALPALGPLGHASPGALGDHLTALHDFVVGSVTVRRGDRDALVLRTVLTHR
jgi:hypothetical protein